MRPRPSFCIRSFHLAISPAEKGPIFKGGYHFGAPDYKVMIRIMVFWGLYPSPPIEGNYHVYSILEGGSTGARH